MRSMPRAGSAGSLPGTVHPVKVLYIVGYGRSGSTLLDNLVGEMDGFFSAGELHSLWDREVVGQRPCGCGRLVDDCDVWSVVIKDVLGESLDGDEVMAWQKTFWRAPDTWRVLRHLRRGSESRELDAYANISARLYDAIVRTTGARVVVDSSKRPSLAAMLLGLDGVDPYFVHLVRDPRAVAYSWQRQKSELGLHTPTYSTTRWLSWSLAAEAVHRRVGDGRWLRLRYEDFVADAGAAVRAIVDLTGEPAGTVPVQDAGRVTLGTNHAVAGNPNRFATGIITLRRDDEWKARLSRKDRFLSSLMALPLLRRYGYRVRTGAT